MKTSASGNKKYISRVVYHSRIHIEGLAIHRIYDDTDYNRPIGHYVKLIEFLE